MHSIFGIHEKLGVNLGNGLFIRKDELISPKKSIKQFYDGDFSNYKLSFKVEYSLKKLNPHSFFIFNSEPLLIFFDHSNNISSRQRKQLSKDIWNFNKSALVFVNESSELNIYNGFKYEKSGLLRVLDTISSVADEHKLQQYSYWKIVTSEFWNLRDNDFKAKSRVDTKLLENIKTAREVLTDIKLSSNPLSEGHANRIIGRLIFIRYLIDRKVNFDFVRAGKDLLTKERLPELIKKKDVLYDFFDYLLKKFKGDILPLNGEYSAIYQNHLEVLSNLFAGNNVKTNQLSLFNVFDFEFIPIELISNIYETFLGENQDKDKAFYTPPFLVDYVLSQTVKPFVSNQKISSKLSCKTVDFTCGSGIFLCETLRTILNRYIELENPDKSSIEFKAKIKKLIKDNIFGNDVNQEAIEIAKFSLFITLLDYFEDPKDIEGFEFPSISDNFTNLDVFSEKLDKVFGENRLIEPDFIIGNPPWGTMGNSTYLEYCSERGKRENEIKKKVWEKEMKQQTIFKPIEIVISNKEFAQAFLLRLSDFSTPKTICQVIVTSKLLYNLYANQFRNYFLNNFSLNEVVEISSVRHQIFANAVGPAAIIRYKYAFGRDTKENHIDYISLKPNPFFAIFKTILIEKHDYKEIIQNELIQNDWLWKVLVYGHILDYRFIKRLRDENKFSITLDRLIDDNENKKRPLYINTGIIVGDRSHDASHYKGMYYIETDSKKTRRPSDLKAFYTYFNKLNTWQENKAERIRPESFFKIPPTLLIKKGLTADFKLIASITHIPCVFAQSVYGIKSKKCESQLLENILGLISSDLICFYMMMCGSSTGVEREQLINNELRPIPFIESKIVPSIITNLIKTQRLIEIHKRKSFPDNLKINKYQDQFESYMLELNYHIFELYGISEIEKDLISYCQEITIPILQARNKKFREILNTNKLSRPFKKVSNPEIIEYINVFKGHFSKFHNGESNGYINARILHSENIISIEFYIDKKQRPDRWIEEPDNTKALELLASFGFQKVSNELFIQKDVKTLKKNSFSILKLNQYKYWHKAIARIDTLEISEAMLQSQMQFSDGKGL